MEIWSGRPEAARSIALLIRSALYGSRVPSRLVTWIPERLGLTSAAAEATSPLTSVAVFSVIVTMLLRGRKATRPDCYADGVSPGKTRCARHWRGLVMGVVATHDLPERWVRQ